MTDRDLTDIRIDRKICDTQGKIFDQANRDGYDINVFTDKYMNSVFCQKGMDYRASRYTFEDPDTCLHEIYKEIGKPGNAAYNEAAYWIGYTYRQLAYETDMPSRDVIKKVPLDKLILNFAAHHCMDENNSTDDLCRFYGLEKSPLYREYTKYLDSL